MILVLHIGLHMIMLMASTMGRYRALSLVGCSLLLQDLCIFLFTGKNIIIQITNILSICPCTESH